MPPKKSKNNRKRKSVTKSVPEARVSIVANAGDDVADHLHQAVRDESKKSFDDTISSVAQSSAVHTDDRILRKNSIIPGEDEKEGKEELHQQPEHHKNSSTQPPTVSYDTKEQLIESNAFENAIKDNKLDFEDEDTPDGQKMSEPEISPMTVQTPEKEVSDLKLNKQADLQPDEQSDAETERKLSEATETSEHEESQGHTEQNQQLNMPWENENSDLNLPWDNQPQQENLPWEQQSHLHESTRSVSQSDEEKPPSIQDEQPDPAQVNTFLAKGSSQEDKLPWEDQNPDQVSDLPWITEAPVQNTQLPWGQNSPQDQSAEHDQNDSNGHAAPEDEASAQFPWNTQHDERKPFPWENQVPDKTEHILDEKVSHEPVHKEDFPWYNDEIKDPEPLQSVSEPRAEAEPVQNHESIEEPRHERVEVPRQSVEESTQEGEKSGQDSVEKKLDELFADDEIDQKKSLSSKSFDFLELDDDLLDDDLLEPEPARVPEPKPELRQTKTDSVIKKKPSHSYIPTTSPLKNYTTPAQIQKTQEFTKNLEAAKKKNDAYDFPSSLITQKVKPAPRIQKYAPTAPRKGPNGIVETGSLPPPSTSTSSLPPTPSAPSIGSRTSSQPKAFFEELPIPLPKAAPRPARAAAPSRSTPPVNVSPAPGPGPIPGPGHASALPKKSPVNPYANIAKGPVAPPAVGHVGQIPPPNLVGPSAGYSPIGQVPPPNPMGHKSIGDSAAAPIVGSPAHAPIDHVGHPPVLGNAHPPAAVPFPSVGNKPTNAPAGFKQEKSSSPYIPKAGPYAPSSHRRTNSRASSLVGGKGKEVNPYAPVTLPKAQVNPVPVTNASMPPPPPSMHPIVPAPPPSVHQPAPHAPPPAAPPAHYMVPSMAPSMHAPAAPAAYTAAAPVAAPKSSYAQGAYPQPGLSLYAAPRGPIVEHGPVAEHGVFPVFSWSNSQKLTYVFPSSNSVQVKSVPETIWSNLASFPGPLGKSKSKKKDVEKWLETNIARLDPASDEVLLNHVLLNLVRFDYDTKNPEFITAVCSAINPAVDYRAEVAPNFGHSLHLTANAYKLDSVSVNTVWGYIQAGHTEAALEFCLAKADWSMALIIASALGSEKYSSIASEYARHNFPFQNSQNKVLHLMPILLKIFSGNSKAVVEEMSKVPSEGEWACAHYREITAAVCANKSFEFLSEFAGFLAFSGKSTASEICHILAGTKLSNLPLANGQVFSVLGAETQSFVYSEIYEYASQLSPQPSSYPHLTVLRLRHAQLLADLGLFAESQRYCDIIGSSLKTLGKSPFFGPTAFHEFQNLVMRISESNAADSGWFGSRISKVNLDKMWGHLDKFIGGEEKPKSENGVFSKFSPSISRTGSTLDFTALPQTLPRPHDTLSFRPIDPVADDSALFSPGSASKYAPYSKPSMQAVQREHVSQARYAPSNSSATSLIDELLPPKKVLARYSPITKTDNYPYMNRAAQSSTLSITSMKHRRTTSGQSEMSDFNYHGHGLEQIQSVGSLGTYEDQGTVDQVPVPQPPAVHPEPQAVPPPNNVPPPVNGVAPAQPVMTPITEAAPTESRESVAGPVVAVDPVPETESAPPAAAHSAPPVEVSAPSASPLAEVVPPSGSAPPLETPPAPTGPAPAPPRAAKPRANPYAPTARARPRYASSSSKYTGSSRASVVTGVNEAQNMFGEQVSQPSAPASVPVQTHAPAHEPASQSAPVPAPVPAQVPEPILVPSQSSPKLLPPAMFSPKSPRVTNVDESFDELPPNPRQSLLLGQGMSPHKNSAFEPYQPAKPSGLALGDYPIPGSPELTTRANSVIGANGLYSSRLSQSQQSVLYQQYEVHDDTVRDYVPVPEDDEDDDGEAARREEEARLARLEQQAHAAATQRATAAATQRAAAAAGAGSRWFNWLGNKNGEPKPHKVHLGEPQKFEYDEKLKRWIDRSRPLEEQLEAAKPPPPPKKAAPVAAPGPAPASAPGAGPAPARAPVAPRPGPTAPTGAPGGPPGGPPGAPQVAPLAPSTSAPKPGPPAAKPSLASAGLDDLLSLGNGSGSSVASGRKTKRGSRRGYVNVLDKN